MWMIANRLIRLEPELHIPENAPVDLLSARLAVARHSVYIYQKGNDVICSAGEQGGYLVFHDALYARIFDVVQAVFDFYQEWMEMLEEARINLDYVKILDQSWLIFRNPMVLLNGSNRVLYMSSRYANNEVNNDWKYLKEHGHSSVRVIEYMMNTGKSHEFYMSSHAQIYHFPDQDIQTDMISAALYYENTHCGRLNVIEYERKLNPGDIYMVDLLGGYLSQILGQINRSDGEREKLLPYFSRMLLGQPVTDVETEYWKRYINWSENKAYQICVLSFAEPLNAESSVRVRDYLQLRIPQCLAVPVDGNIAFSVSDSQWRSMQEEKVLSNLQSRLPFMPGLSLPFHQVEGIHHYYTQAVKAIRYQAMKAGLSLEAYRFAETDFYEYAVRDLIENAMGEQSRYSCHPDILRMWENTDEKMSEDISTYFQYLKNHCSIAKTARDLFVHKNTLIYRIRKIEADFLNFDGTEYTIHYMLLSMYILSLLLTGRC